MRRLLTASALFALALYAATAAGQPQPNPKPKGADKTDPADLLREAQQRELIEKQREKVIADAANASIAAALANDPDVRMAKAKVQLAEAELAKARQAVTLKVLTLKARIEQLKAEVRMAEDRAAWAARMVQTGALQQSQLLVEREKLDTAKAALALAETEWKLLTGAGASGAAADPSYDKTVASALKYLGEHTANSDAAARLAHFFAVMDLVSAREAVKGPIPERIRAALDKPVKLGAKGEKVTFEKALAAFKKDAGLDVPVRGSYPSRTTFNPNKPNEPPQSHPIEVVSEGEELPVGAWFQLFEDSATYTTGSITRRYRFYVREYGLLISSADNAPPDAPSLTDFWKQKPPAPKK
jgi:hypothetical protein